MTDSLKDTMIDIARSTIPPVIVTERDIEKMTEYGIPDYMQYGLIHYFEQRQPTGDFLRAVLENDLIGAFIFADDENKEYMRSYVMWLYNCPPGRSPNTWGSPAAVENWLAGARDD